MKILRLPKSRMAATALIGAAFLTLTACTTTEPDPVPTETPIETVAPEPEPVETPAPEFFPEGTAEQNLPYFDYVNMQTLAADPTASSRVMVDRLAEAGFNKDDMEVTYDRTNVDLEADYIIVAVLMGDQCLIGQRVSGEYSSIVAAPIAATGLCLVGKTQPIDW